MRSLLRWLSGKVIKESANTRDAVDTGSIPGMDRFSGGGNGKPLHILIWRISRTEEPGRLQSMGLQGIRHDWSDSTQLTDAPSRALEVLHDSCCSYQPTMPAGISGCIYVSLVAQMVKNLPSVWVTWVWSLGQEDPLEKEMETDSSILARIIPWTEEPRGPQSMGLQRVTHDWVAFTHSVTCGDQCGSCRKYVV